MARLLRRRHEPVVVLRVGSVGLVGTIEHLVPDRGVTVVERARPTIPHDGLAPSIAELVVEGRWSRAILGLAPDAAPALDSLADLLAFSRPDDRVGPLIELAIGDSGIPVESAQRGVVAGWAIGGLPAAPYVVDVDDIDRGEPWHLTFGWSPAAGAVVRRLEPGRRRSRPRVPNGPESGSRSRCRVGSASTPRSEP